MRKLVDGVGSEWDVSIRRACRVLEMDTSSTTTNPVVPTQASLEGRIKVICQTRVRYGYRRVHVMLLRDGWRVKAKLRDDRRAATEPNKT